MLLEGYVKNYATLFHKKRELRTDQPQSVGSRTLFYPISIMPQILIEDPSNLKHPKNVKGISNTVVSHQVRCCVIPRQVTMKGWQKEVF